MVAGAKPQLPQKRFFFPGKAVLHHPARLHRSPDRRMQFGDGRGKALSHLTGQDGRLGSHFLGSQLASPTVQVGPQHSRFKRGHSLGDKTDDGPGQNIAGARPS